MTPNAATLTQFRGLFFVCGASVLPTFVRVDQDHCPRFAPVSRDGVFSNMNYCEVPGMSSLSYGFGLCRLTFGNHTHQVGNLGLHGLQLSGCLGGILAGCAGLFAGVVPVGLGLGHAFNNA